MKEVCFHLLSLINSWIDFSTTFSELTNSVQKNSDTKVKKLMSIYKKMYNNSINSPSWNKFIAISAKKWV